MTNRNQKTSGIADDPVFAAIKAHRAAVLECDAAFELKATTDEGWAKLEQQQRDAAVREYDAILTLLETMPTTPAGVAAALRYVGSRCRAEERALLMEAHNTYHKNLPDVAETYLVRLGEAVAGMLATT
jgi:hypothetical protein